MSESRTFEHRAYRFRVIHRIHGCTRNVALQGRSADSPRSPRRLVRDMVANASATKFEPAVAWWSSAVRPCLDGRSVRANGRVPANRIVVAESCPPFVSGPSSTDVLAGIFRHLAARSACRRNRPYSVRKKTYQSRNIKALRNIRFARTTVI